MYTVGEFMTKKDDLHVVKPTTTVDEGSCFLSFKVPSDCLRCYGVSNLESLLFLLYSSRSTCGE